MMPLRRRLMQFGPDPNAQPDGPDPDVMQSPPMNAAPAQVAPQPPQLPPFDVAARLAQLYKPQNTAETAYMNNLNAMPNRADFHPGNLDRILSTIAGLGTGGPTSHWGGQPVGYQGNPAGAFQVSRGLLDQPFEQKLGDWETKNKALASSAGIENQRNVGELRAAHEEISNELTNRNRDIQQQRADFERDKSNQINKYKYDKMEQDLTIAQQKLEEAQRKFDADSSNRDRLYELKQHESTVKQMDFMLNYNKAMDDLKRKKDEFEQNQIRLKQQFEQNLGFRGEQLNRGTQKVTTGPDASGKTITKTETTTRTPSKNNLIPPAVNNAVQNQVQKGEKQITMVGPDGSIHLVPESKVQDAMTNYQMKVKQ